MMEQRQTTYVLFEIAGAAYAVRSDQVAMIDMVGTITWVPNAPDFVAGVTSIRGQVIPVIHVRKRFRMEDAPVNLRSRIVVIRQNERMVGMLVDTAREFVKIAPDQIKSTEGLDSPGVDYLDGVATLPDRLALVVNLERILNMQEQALVRETAEAVGEPEAPRDGPGLSRGGQGTTGDGGAPAGPVIAAQ
jgi:purine-binding chemotaxis protein CheW